MLGANTQQIVSSGLLPAALQALFQRVNRGALLALASYFVDINSLCASNPDPPQPFTPAEIVQLSVLTGPLAVPMDDWALAKLSKWLDYGAFFAFCQCKPPVVNPVLNCLHTVNVSVPGGVGQTVPLGSVTIEPVVYDSWPDNGSSWTIHRTGSWSPGAGGAGTGHDWDLEVQLPNLTWIALESNLTLPQGADAERFLSIQSAFKFGRIAALRLRNSSGTARSIARLDYCFSPTIAAVPPVPDQPPLPGLPDNPPPLCSSDDLCLLVLELGRSVSRLSSQLSDVQALVGGVDQLVPMSSQPISGEGEVTLPVGCRGVRISLTVIGAGVFTSALGRPRGLMRAGSIRWGDGQAYSEREFVDADNYMRLRPQGSLSLSWQLINGCSGTLTFLT